MQYLQPGDTAEILVQYSKTRFKDGEPQIVRYRILDEHRIKPEKASKERPKWQRSKKVGLGEDDEYLTAIGCGLLTKRRCVIRGKVIKARNGDFHFKVFSVSDPPMPKDPEGMARWIADLKLPGLGDKKAMALVDKYRTDETTTEDVIAILKDTEKLAEIKGISPRIAGEIVFEMLDREKYDPFVEWFRDSRFNFKEPERLARLAYNYCDKNPDFAIASAPEKTSAEWVDKLKHQPYQLYWVNSGFAFTGLDWFVHEMNPADFGLMPQKAWDKYHNEREAIKEKREISEEEKCTKEEKQIAREAMKKVRKINHPLSYTKERIEAGVMNFVRQEEAKGNSCIAKDDLFQRVKGELFAKHTGSFSDIERLFEQILLSKKHFWLENLNGTFYVYRRSVGFAEYEVARMLKSRLSPLTDPLPKEVVLREINKTKGLSDKQKEGILGAFQNRLSIITGGPGMGKTYCLNTILKTYEALNPSGKGITLCAPTGRAAVKMEENTGHLATTIHKLTNLTDKEDGYTKYPQLIDTDMVIVDEFSMVDIQLFCYLLRSVHSSVALVLIGDKDQLPSVGCGNVLSDLIESGKVPTTVLDRIFRQAEGSTIVKGAQMVKDGKTLIHTELVEDENGKKKEINVLNLPKNVDTTFIETGKNDDEACLKKVKKLTKEAGKKLGFDNVQVITPRRGGARKEDRSRPLKTSAISLNRELHDIFNPIAKGVVKERRDKEDEAKGKGLEKTTLSEDRDFVVGDRVMHTKNLTTDKFFLANGDMGKVVDVDDQNHTVTVYFDDKRTYIYEGDEKAMLELSYAMTVHKSQGSEYDAVILPLTDDMGSMLTRKLLYTAMTRAKKKLIIIGSKSALETAIRENQGKRMSLLGVRLKGDFDAKKNSYHSGDSGYAWSGRVSCKPAA